MIQTLLSQHPHWPIVDNIAKQLISQGHRVVLAGGCVRDALLGVLAQDLDIATDATPEQVATYFEKVLHIGKSFGVCRIVEEGVSIEVATFREESDYRDGRHPEKIVYSTLEKDALRRDFTVNAMYYDFQSKELIDLVGGQKDIKARWLTTVGDPVQRFSEDHLRVLRGARFAAQLNFDLDPKTQKAMAQFAGDIHKISRERIHDEFEKAFKSYEPFRFFEILRQTGVLKELIPDLSEASVIGFLGKSRKVDGFLENFFSTEMPSMGLGWAALLWARIKSGVEKSTGEEWLKSFKVSHQEIAEALMIIKAETFFTTDKSALMLFVLMAKSDFMASIEFYWQRVGEIFQAPASWDHKWQRYHDKYLSEGELAEPLIDGKDLLAAELTPGAEFKLLLDKAYLYQLEHPRSTKAEILKFILPAH
jgi:tRNA nucleotidyltransferase/poly(A) polymerase